VDEIQISSSLPEEEFPVQSCVHFHLHGHHGIDPEYRVVNIRPAITIHKSALRMLPGADKCPYQIRRLTQHFRGETGYLQHFQAETHEN
jgi:hypothetical protein